MSAHHDHHDNHSNESKPIAFRTPIILALVTVLIILLAVNTCDGKKHSECECKEPCTPECMTECEEKAKGDHHAAAAHHSDDKSAHEAVSDTVVETPVVDTTQTH